mmetsp:Transcript_106722/g.184083  ORF Transcript_106722/g.184083 Transcript_106722/m.184083 type:complete len:202 (+) Transcript_106722:2116-2721(+)
MALMTPTMGSENNNTVAVPVNSSQLACAFTRACCSSGVSPSKKSGTSSPSPSPSSVPAVIVDTSLGVMMDNCLPPSPSPAIFCKSHSTVKSTNSLNSIAPLPSLSTPANNCFSSSPPMFSPRDFISCPNSITSSSPLLSTSTLLKNGRRKSEIRWSLTSGCLAPWGPARSSKSADKLMSPPSTAFMRTLSIRSSAPSLRQW